MLRRIDGRIRNQNSTAWCYIWYPFSLVILANHLKRPVQYGGIWPTMCHLCCGNVKCTQTSPDLPEELEDPEHTGRVSDPVRTGNGAKDVNFHDELMVFFQFLKLVQTCT